MKQLFIAVFPTLYHCLHTSQGYAFSFPLKGFQSKHYKLDSLSLPLRYLSCKMYFVKSQKAELEQANGSSQLNQQWHLDHVCQTSSKLAACNTENLHKLGIRDTNADEMRYGSRSDDIDRVGEVNTGVLGGYRGRRSVKIVVPIQNRPSLIDVVIRRKLSYR